MVNRRMSFTHAYSLTVRFRSKTHAMTPAIDADAGSHARITSILVLWPINHNSIDLAVEGSRSYLVTLTILILLIILIILIIIAVTSEIAGKYQIPTITPR